MSSPAAPARSTAWRAVVPVVMVLAGLLFGTSAALARGGGSEHPQDLAGLIRESQQDVAGLAERADALRREVEELAAQRSPADTATVQAEALAPLVGTEPVTGPAVRVTLDDAGYTLDTIPEGYTVDDVVVHQQDVQGVVNALWAGGAEAMMIQDQRIIASSSVQCVGNTLYLQGRVYSPPYTVTAIGDVTALRESLQSDPVVANYRGWSEALGLGYAVETLGSADLPGYTGVVRVQHAQVIDPRVPSTPEEGLGER